MTKSLMTAVYWQTGAKACTQTELLVSRPIRDRVYHQVEAWIGNRIGDLIVEPIRRNGWAWTETKTHHD